MNLRELEYLLAVDEEYHFNGIEESTILFQKD